MTQDKFTLTSKCFIRGDCSFFFIACLVLFAVGCQPASIIDNLEERRPNIVLILADDLGIGDVGIYRNGPIQTPNIDALAQSGVKFEQAYVTHPVCSPSRAGLISGLYQQRHGWEFNAAQRDKKYGMSAEVSTIADALLTQGYETALIGKWHLGHQAKHHPNNRGFKEFFGVLDGGTTYINSSLPGSSYSSINSNVEQAPPTKRPNSIYRNFKEIEVEEYITDVFTSESVDFIHRAQDKPFFLFLSHITPHTPLQSIDKYTLRYSHIDDQRSKIYASMVSSLDDSVGTIVQTLKDLGLSDNTLVVFASDNGCAGYIEGACSNYPFRGHKRFHHEGGIRIPLIMSWPSALPKSTTYKDPVITLDFHATFQAAAGSTVSSTTDSINLLPYITGNQNSSPHEYLYWRSGPTVAIRDERWKLIRYNNSPLTANDLRKDGRLEPPASGWSNESPDGQLTMLYDLKSDPSESNNLANTHPEIVKRLETAHQQWALTLARPIIPGIRSTLAEVDGTIVQLIF